MSPGHSPSFPRHTSPFRHGDEIVFTPKVQAQVARPTSCTSSWSRRCHEVSGDPRPQTDSIRWQQRELAILGRHLRRYPHNGRSSCKISPRSSRHRRYSKNRPSTIPPPRHVDGIKPRYNRTGQRRSRLIASEQRHLGEHTLLNPASLALSFEDAPTYPRQSS